jgi:hypothetical protein
MASGQQFQNKGTMVAPGRRNKIPYKQDALGNLKCGKNDKNKAYTYQISLAQRKPRSIGFMAFLGTIRSTLQIHI